MNNQQKLVALAGITTVAVISLLLYLNSRRRKKCQDSDGIPNEDDELEFADLTASAAVASASETVVQVKVPQYAVGAIIGKGGQSIRQLKKETGTRLDFNDRETEKKEVNGDENEKNERILLIRGEREKVLKAKMKVKQLIEAQPPIVSTEMVVPQLAIGRIIGKGGQTIREMCRSSGAKILVERGDETRIAKERKVLISGNSIQVDYAKLLIEEKIEQEKEFRLKGGKREGAGDNKRSISPSPKKQFPQVELPNTTDYFKVFVSAFDVPEHFWVQLVTPESTELDSLTAEMTKYYASLDANSERLEHGKVGNICCAPFDFDKEWYRACIQEINNDRTVSLYYIDFGDSGKQSIDNLRKPRPEYLNLPAQAIECYLAGVAPKGNQWTEESIQDFEELSQCAQWAVMMAKIVGYKDTINGKVPYLELIDTNNETDINLAEEMIRREHAVHLNSKDSNEISNTAPSQKAQNSNTELELGTTDHGNIGEPAVRVETNYGLKLSDGKEVSGNRVVVTDTVEDKVEKNLDLLNSKFDNKVRKDIADNVTCDEVTVPVTQSFLKSEKGDFLKEKARLESEYAVKRESVTMPQLETKPSEADKQDKVQESKSTDKPKFTTQSSFELAKQNPVLDSADSEKLVSNHVDIESQNKFKHHDLQTIEENDDADLEESITGPSKADSLVTGQVSKEESESQGQSPELDVKRNNSFLLTSLELSKQNPVLYTSDDDADSFTSAHSELTSPSLTTDADDGDTLSFLSAREDMTPTNEDTTFEFPSAADDYEIITTPVGSDEESDLNQQQTPKAYIASENQEKTKAKTHWTPNAKTPGFEIKVIDETQSRSLAVPPQTKRESSPTRSPKETTFGVSPSVLSGRVSPLKGHETAV